MLAEPFAEPVMLPRERMVRLCDYISVKATQPRTSFSRLYQLVRSHHRSDGSIHGHRHGCFDRRTHRHSLQDREIIARATRAIDRRGFDAFESHQSAQYAQSCIKQIGEWISEDLTDSPQDHQLIIDLEDSVICCKMLMKWMENVISKLEFGADGSVASRSKIRMVLDNQASRDFQKLIDRQIIALTLLLAACNW